MPSKYFLMLLCIAFCAQLMAQNGLSEWPSKKKIEKPLSFFDYIVEDSIAEITMIADFSTLRKNKYQETYYSGHLNFLDAEKQMQSIPVSFRARGKSRKKVCYHPALKLKFPKKELKAKGLNEDNKYKLVCQCSMGKTHQQTLLREYLAYKIYNLISPNSFQVHLLQINYIESTTNKREKRFGFLIESEESLGKRLDGKVINRDQFSFDKISRKESIRMSLFQYMISNTDWNINAMHNVKILLDKNDTFIPIPYDYDYSGLAKTPYATTNPDYPAKTITDRYFLSQDYTAAEINEQLIYFHQQKAAVQQLLADFDLLSKRSNRFVIRFINNFYKTIEDPKKVVRELVRD